MSARAEFIRAVAEYLVSDTGRKRVELQMGKSDAVKWAKAYSLSGCRRYASADEAGEAIRELLGGGAPEVGGELISLLNSAVPYSTTFLFLEPGCESVGQETPLAKAIEAAMQQKFRCWEQSWIRPRAESLCGKAEVAVC